MRRTRAAAAAVVATAALTLTACTTDSDSAQNAVAVGGTFQFHSPGGQTEIFYDESERAPLPDIAGDSLMEEGEQISLSDFE
ncbi:MAG: TlpA family protein disulfide reductase, partial [Corynebacterium humireducens]|nr:TlpA family protein disulfide reductase [Corynebacterium humireducens]